MKRSGYAPVNGLNMYYEIEGEGPPLVYIPPHLGVAGIYSVPSLTLRHSVVTIDLQGHGRTADVDGRPMSLQQNAKDVVGLLRHLGISRASFLGQSYGGATATLIALSDPDLVDCVATYGATFGPPSDAHNSKMLRFEEPPTPESRCFEFQRASYQQTAPHPECWPTFWQKRADIRWDGFSHDELRSIRARVLIALGDQDFVRIEHAVEAFRLIPNAELSIIPDAGHFALSSEQERVLPVVEHFLTKPTTRLPIATAGMGYRPGQTR